MRVVLLHHYYTSESRCDKNHEIEVMFMENRMKKNGIEYVLAGEYYIPDLRLPDEERPIGKYDRMHRDYLMEYNPMRFDDLVLEGQLWTYLAELNEQVQSRLQLIISQMQEVETVTEELKENNQWFWIQSTNSIHNRAEEIVLKEIKNKFL